jgi:hypothetical protein
MKDEQLDQLLDRAGASYRPPPEPDLDALWRGIDARRRRSRGGVRRTPLWWGVRVTGIAAALAIAFSLGRITAAPTATGAADTVAQALPDVLEQPVTAVATELLGQTVILLAALPEERSDSIPDQRFTQQAGALLTTTRLLLDSPAAANDPRLHNLLEDLELVLAQIARLQKGSQSKMELEIITDALQQQDLVPRIRSVAAGLNAGAD